LFTSEIQVCCSATVGHTIAMVALFYRPNSLRYPGRRPGFRPRSISTCRDRSNLSATCFRPKKVASCIADPHELVKSEVGNPVCDQLTSPHHSCCNYNTVHSEVRMNKVANLACHRYGREWETTASHNITSLILRKSSRGRHCSRRRFRLEARANSAPG